MKKLMFIFIMLCSITLYSQDTIVKRALRSPYLLDWSLITNDTISYLLGLDSENIYKGTSINNNFYVTGNTKLGNAITDTTSINGILGINSANKFSSLSVVSTTGTNGNNMFNFVSKANMNRSTYEQAIDTSSLSLSYTNSGSPLFQLKKKTGGIVFKTDSTHGFVVGGNPTTVSAVFVFAST